MVLIPVALLVLLAAMFSILAAVEFLIKLAQPGDERTISAHCARLEHGEWIVRHAAVEALSKLAQPGDERTISAKPKCHASNV